MESFCEDQIQGSMPTVNDHFNFYITTMNTAVILYHGIFEHHQVQVSWRDLPGHRHGKLFIGRPCTKRADDLLRLSRPQLKMVGAILTGHAPVRKHLKIMGLFDGDPTCRFCRMETETVQHIICCCEALASQRCNVFGRLIAEPKDKSTASKGPLPLYEAQGY
jgi:hypothetical protein